MMIMSVSSLETCLIIEETWKVRDEHARRFDDKHEAIFEYLLNQQKAGTRKVVSFINALPESPANKTVKSSHRK